MKAGNMKDEKAVVKISFFPYNIHVMVFWDFPRKYAPGKSAGTSDHAFKHRNDKREKWVYR